MILSEVKYGKFIEGEVIGFKMLVCGGCGIPFYVPAQWLEKKQEAKGEFNCPNGCSRVFVAETEADKLKKKLKELELAKQLQEEELTNRYLDEMSKSNKLEKQLKRVHNGVCPCCKRSFANLKAHMLTKHPEMVPVKGEPVQKKVGRPRKVK